MNEFISRFADKIMGVLSGFDRLVFRGHLLPLMRDGGIHAFLSYAGVRLLDFKDFVLKTSDAIKQAAIAEAEAAGRPIRYLESSRPSKEDLAREILAEHPVDEGLICLFKTVEPCMSFEYHRSPNKSERGLKLRTRKCLHLYKYFVHPVFGFMSARLQTWFPFTIQVCLNGREWLATELASKGDLFLREDNCVTWFASAQRQVQRLFDKQLETDWTRALTQIARHLNPMHRRIFEPWPMDYYWSAYQTEWATDILFDDPRALAAVYPSLVRHAMHHLQSPDVMRFLGRKIIANFAGELVTSFKNRPEGVRVKHWVAGNSIKMYDKAASVLRVETTIGNVTPFKVFRPADDDRPERKLAWRPLRKGVADLHRRAQVSQYANDSYLGALAAANDDTKVALRRGVAPRKLPGSSRPRVTHRRQERRRTPPGHLARRVGNRRLPKPRPPPSPLSGHAASHRRKRPQAFRPREPPTSPAPRPRDHQQGPAEPSLPSHRQGATTHRSPLRRSRSHRRETHWKGRCVRIVATSEESRR
jgi:hypothetical protein